MKKADWNLWIRSKYTGRKRKDGIDMEETTGITEENDSD